MRGSVASFEEGCRTLLSLGEGVYVCICITSMILSITICMPSALISIMYMIIGLISRILGKRSIV